RLHIPLAHQESESTNRLASAGRLAENFRPLWVAALMPLFVLGEGRFLLFGVLAVAILWTLTGLATGEWGRWSPATASLVAFLALVPVTMLVTPSPALTQEHLGYFLAQLITFCAVSTWATTQQRAQILASSLVGIGCLLA